MTKVRFVMPAGAVDYPLEKLLGKPANVAPELVRHEYIDPPFRLRVRDLRIEDGALIGDIGPNYEGLDNRGTLDLSKLYVVVAKPVLGGTDVV